MLVAVIAQFFKLKVVSSVIVLTCGWRSHDQVKLIRQMSAHGMSATFSCDPGILKDITDHGFQGVLYFEQDYDDGLLKKVKQQHFAHWYKWLLIGDGLPENINKIRYDSDMAFVRSNRTSIFDLIELPVHLDDVFIRPGQEAALFPWATWTKSTGIEVKYNSEKISRRLNFERSPLKIVSPVGYYSPNSYNGSFKDYLMEDIDPQRDSAIRAAYIASSLTLQSLNASEILLEAHYWSDLTTNESMLSMIRNGHADVSGAILRIMISRVEIVDYILPIWPFGVGFTYLAERESSTNMYVEPFSAGVWLTCFGIVIVLALSQRVTARRLEEKEGAFIGVLASWLQQDASAVPEGLSGRWSFMVMSTSAMLVHAYYTSAIVSALMSTGRGGPTSLRALGDSKYSIASEDYDYMRYLFWEVETDWADLEYLKKKKMKLSSLYVDMKKGVELISDGSTAYHAEYNKIYPYFSTLHDDQLCKLQYLATIPEQLSWTTATKRGQFTDMLRSRGAWLHETGLAYRIVSRLRMRPPPCRASLLAERVAFGDVASLLTLTAIGAVLSVIILGIELAYVRTKKKKEAFEGDMDDDTEDLQEAEDVKIEQVRDYVE